MYVYVNGPRQRQINNIEDGTHLVLVKSDRAVRAARMVGTVYAVYASRVAAERALCACGVPVKVKSRFSPMQSVAVGFEVMQMANAKPQI